MVAVSGSTAAVIGMMALSTAATITVSSMQADAASKRAKQVQRGVDEEKKQILQAPAIAAARAKEDTLNRRRGRAKTVLTGSRGVLETNTVKKKQLLGQ